MSKVWVYPERKFEELGAERWHLSWEAVKPAALDKDDIDIDEDIVWLSVNYKSKEAAIKRARKVVDSFTTAFGAVTVTRQVVDWFVEEDRIAEWANTSDEEVVD